MCGIYKITNLINNKSYIGQSKNIKRRWQEHIYGTKSSSIHYAISKYGVKNFKFEILEECDENMLDDREVYWIKYYGTFDFGYNLTRGGNSGFFYDINAIYEDYLKTNSMKKTAKNVGCSESTVRNCLRIFDIDKSDLQQNKPVEQIDPTTLEIIKSYNSIQEAADAVGKSHAHITGAIRGDRLSAGGYYWRLKGDLSKQFEIKEIKKHKRKINQYKLDKKTLIKTHDSMADAARYINKNPKTGSNYIRMVCSGKKESAYGYYWEYADE